MVENSEPVKPLDATAAYHGGKVHDLRPLNRKRRRAILSVQRRLARCEARIEQRSGLVVRYAQGPWGPVPERTSRAPLPSAEPFIQRRAALNFRLGQLVTL